MIVTSYRPTSLGHGLPLSKNFPYRNTIAVFGNLCPNIVSDKPQQVQIQKKVHLGL